MKKEIPAFDTYEFSISGIMTPNSTYESDAIRIQVFESSDMKIITNEDNSDMTVITIKPYNLQLDQSFLNSTVTGAGLETRFTINV